MGQARSVNSPVAFASIIWLTSEQGGRRSGPPPGPTYAPTCVFPLGGAEAMRTYELTTDTTMYFGKVAGGEGYQALVPREIVQTAILRQLEARVLQGPTSNF